MWSEHFAAEERSALPPTTALVFVTLSGALLAACAIVAEILFSIQVTSREVSIRGGSILVVVVSLGLGFAGPYASICMWRAPSGGDSRLRRLGHGALVAFVVAAVALAWLLLIHTTQRHGPNVL
ncbi:MAG TPA: hypothetical protein VEH29_13435 [Acidimicrobiales bacterium]|nr:hypothetical protein [Acidimicrobiales bacterium]